MPVLVKSAGFITAIWGEAFRRLPDGRMEQLKVGDKVEEHEVILTTQDGIVQISPETGGFAAAKAKLLAGDIDKAIEGLQSQDEDAAPAAGLTGGGGSALSEGYRVDRVAESVGGAQQEFNFAGTSSLDSASAAPTGLILAQPVADTTAPTVSVNAPDNTSDTTPTINGTTSAPVGSTVTIQIVDAGGGTQTLTTTVQPGGVYSVTPTTDIAEGPYTVKASVTSATGVPGVAIDAGNVDTTAPGITVNAPDNTADLTPTIIGVTDAPAGSTVTLIVLDAMGATQTLTAVVQADGSYSATPSTPLAEGAYSVAASVSDPSGNVGHATDAGGVQMAIPTVTVTATDVSEGAVTVGTPVATFVGADADAGDTLSYALLNNANGYFAISGNQVVLTAAGVAAVNDDALNLTNLTVTVQVTDAIGHTSSGSDVADVVRVNDAPVLSLATPVQLTEGGATAGIVVTTASAVDPEGDKLTYSLTAGSDPKGYYSIDADTGVVTLTQAGADLVNAGGDLPAVNVTVTDGQASDTESVNVPATVDVNDAPVLSLTTPTALTEGTATVGQTITTASATDEDGDKLTYSLTAGSDPKGYYSIDA
ncbi:MAG: Ig-like domain-containing protein, partial [Aquabacterium sp.]|uniref:Ig-like domain-containing protein n=1 Tax=Aquabacterium sp. TaxID=1872578 RepID=UPI003BD57A07